MQVGQGRPATMTDVARRAGVSQATVSYVLNASSRHSISTETREQVLQAAHDLGYRPNRNAQSLAAGLSSVILCVVPHAHLGEPVMTLLGELSTAFSERGLVMAVHFEAGGQSVRSAVNALRPRFVLPLFGPEPLAEAGHHATVQPFDDPGCLLQVQTLLALGHERLGFAASDHVGLSGQTTWRETSLQHACKKAGIAAPEKFTVVWEGDQTRIAVENLAADGVTAICAQNDELAFGVLRAIEKAGLRCPDDISVIGYDATALGGLFSPALTSIRWSPREVATMVVENLLGADTTAARDWSTGPFAVELVERASTAAARPAPRTHDVHPT